MKAIRLFLFLSLGLWSGLAAASGPTNDELEKALKAGLVGKIITIRNFYSPNHLEYRSDGSIKKASIERGPWTIDGEMISKDIKVKDNKITIEGSRLVVMFRSKELKPVYGRGKKVTIDVDRDATQDPIKAIDQVFIGGGQKLSELAPDYWRDYLRHRESHPVGGDMAELVRGIRQAAGAEQAQKLTSDSANEMKIPESVTTEGQQIFVLPTTAEEESMTKGILRVGGDVKPPHAISTPDPAYNDYARQNRYQAQCTLWLIVDENGAPQNIRIERPAGFGLDEQAVEAVQKWKFTPATKSGVPVAVQINVEINFHLY